ncbi:Low-temperature-induced protein [Quillaja saponaria]|uniref:Low-temperature-induced protein n=1 Tax=Quillaja saponaria TaxID=32244 RepID=A0AAD7VM95_QUISA|nr:Low-temperature-induced protein [Quillaja saponaria]
MAQLDRTHRYADHTPTVEQLLRGGESARWSPNSSSSSSPLSMRDLGLEDDHGHHQKKSSVLTKVKEKAKKLRHTLSKKRHGDEDGNVTPSLGVSLEDYEEEEDAEYLGAPMYESELAPEEYRANARQHPRAIPFISEKHVLTSSVKEGVGKTSQEKPHSPNRRATQAATANLSPKATAQAMTSKPLSPNNKATQAATVKLSSPEKATAQAMTSKPPSPNKTATQVATAKLLSPNKATAQAMTSEPLSPHKIRTETASSNPHDPNKTITETVTEKLAPAYATVSDATHAIASKIQSLTISNPAAEQPSSVPAAQQPSLAPAAPQSGMHANSSDKMWDKGDKGVSIKEYVMNESEPGEDERAPSQVISEAISTRRTPGDAGVVEKVREAVTSLLRIDEPSRNTATHSATSTSSQIPVSTSANEIVEEENHGRILQAN